MHGLDLNCTNEINTLEYTDNLDIYQIPSGSLLLGTAALSRLNPGCSEINTQRLHFRYSGSYNLIQVQILVASENTKTKR